MTPLRELASISQIGKQYEVRLYDPNLVGKTNKLLISSGFSSYISSKDSVTINIPQPSGEEKKKIERVLKGLLEETKIAMRNVRREARKLSDDSEIDKLTSEFISKAESLIMDKI
jgi:ribosome recycling factor